MTEIETNPIAPSVSQPQTLAQVRSSSIVLRTVARLPIRVLQFAGGTIYRLYGVACVIVGLSIVATLPVVQVASLGYMLDVSGRVARERRLRAAAIGVLPAARLGTIAICVFLCLLPLRLLSSLQGSAVLIADVPVSEVPVNGHSWNSAEALDPAHEAPGSTAVTLRWITAIAVTLIVSHVLWALFRGGRLRDFLWPAPRRLWCYLRSGFPWRSRLNELSESWKHLGWTGSFWLGLQGYILSFAWLLLPTALLVQANVREPDSIGIFLISGLPLLAVVATYLPLVQTEFAYTRRWRSLLQIRNARQRFIRAPWAWTIATLLLLAASLPLYLLKTELIPHEAAWLPGLFFVVFMWPARALMGWAQVRSLRRQRPCHWFWRWSARGALLVGALFYAGIIYFTPQFSWYGSASMFEQHAFLLPAPFLRF